jgi:hypothetical protein
VNATATAPVPVRAASARPYRVTSLRVLRSEWAKFWSLRSSWITIAIALVLLLAVGLAGASHYTGSSSASSGQHHLVSFGDNAVSIALAGIGLAQLALGILGVLFTAGEYSTGLSRTTLIAVPRRLPVLWSKAAVLAGVTFVLATVAALVSFLGGEHFLSGSGIALTLSSSGVIRALLGAGVYLALVGVLGVALGALLRSVAGGIAVLVGVLTLLPVLAGLLPSSWADSVSPYLPGNAGSAIYALTHDASTLSPAAGLAVFAGWVALAVGLAAWRLRHSDA